METQIYNIVFTNYDDVLNVKQVSVALGVCTKTVYKLLNTNEIKSRKIGHKFLIPKANVMKYLGIFDFPMCEQPTA